jgi:hypothetical protein
MMFAPLATVFQIGSLFEWLSALALALGVVRHRPEGDPMKDLTFRLRRPTLWTLAHPVRAIRIRRRISR